MPEWLLVIILAPFIGSFLGVLIRRLPSGERIAWVRSICEMCRHQLGARDLLPVISYLVLQGRCRHCHGRISPFHLAIELAALAVAFSAVLAGNDGLPLLAGCALGWTLLALAWIDWQHLVLPDALTLPLVLLGLAVAWASDPADLIAHSYGALVGYLAFAGIASAYRLLRKREGLGAGDAKLLCAAGAWTGLAALPAIVLLAALLGIILAAVLRVLGRTVTMTTAVPFGPCLAAATWAVWLADGIVIPQLYQ